MSSRHITPSKYRLWIVLVFSLCFIIWEHCESIVFSIPSQVKPCFYLELDTKVQSKEIIKQEKEN